MKLRGELAELMNSLVLRITGSRPMDPIDPVTAVADPNYDMCHNTYFIRAGVPANFHTEPCIYEVDAVLGAGFDPWVDPDTGLGYPNYSFFIPGSFWLPGFLPVLIEWVRKKQKEEYSQYPIFIHPNSGCETRDPGSMEWFGHSQKLSNRLSCNSLGCNQACPSNDPPPANCTFL